VADVKDKVLYAVEFDTEASGSNTAIKIAGPVTVSANPTLADVTTLETAATFTLTAAPSP
jgi:hypothetical protein